MTDPAEPHVPRTRYVEAVDSVRFGSPDDEDLKTAAPTAHAFIEVLWALMLGDTVVVPQTYAFDSVGFVDIARRIVEQRPVEESAHHWEPFRLSLYNQPSYLDMIAGNLRKEPEAFKLSSMPTITASAEDRNHLAELVVAGRFDEAANQYPELESHLHGIERLALYFAGRPPIPAQGTVGMQPRLEWIRDLDALPHDPLAAGITPDEFHRLQVGIGTLADAGVSLDNRTEVRTRGGDHVDVATHKALVEMFDTVYNAVLSESLQTLDESLTTSTNPSGLPLAGEHLAQISLTEVVTTTGPSGQASSVERGGRRPLGIEASDVESLDDLLGPVMDQHLAQIWNIRSQAEFQQRAAALHRALLGGDRHEAEHRLGEHLDLMSEWLTDDLQILTGGALILELPELAEELGGSIGDAFGSFLGIEEPIGEMAGALLGKHLGEGAQTKLAQGVAWRLLWRSGDIVESFPS